MTQWTSDTSEGVEQETWASEADRGNSPPISSDTNGQIMVDGNSNKTMMEKGVANEFDNKVKSKVKKVVEGRDIQCGLMSCTPNCMQPCARVIPYFIALFTLLFVQGVNRSYISGQLMNIERRFGLSSKQLSVILIMDNIGNLGIILLLSYYGGKARRPLIMGLGTVLTAFGSFMLTWAHFAFGPGQTDFSLVSKAGGPPKFNPYVCHASMGSSGFMPPGMRDGNSSMLSHMQMNASNMMIKMAGSRPSLCSEEESSESIESNQAFAIFCIGYLLVGAGGSGLYSLGVSYLDDNVGKRRFPVFIGIIYTGRFIGPLCGFFLSFRISKIFVDPSIKPGISEYDPRFVGAWWLGLLGTSAVLLIFSLPMLFFPKHMPNVEEEDSDDEDEGRGGTWKKKSKDKLGKGKKEKKKKDMLKTEAEEDLVRKFMSQPKGRSTNY